MKTEKEVAEFVDKVLREACEKTFGEKNNPRFYLKHILRLQGLALEDNNDIINNSNGILVARLGEVKWKDENNLEYTIQLMKSINFIPIEIDIGKL